jgi:hypothetical protein
LLALRIKPPSLVHPVAANAARARSD